MSEANELNRDIVTLGNARGGFLWRNNTGAYRANGRMVHYGKVGSGDVIGVYRGYFVSIETKTPHDTASIAQLNFVTLISMAGGYAIFAHSLDDAIELFDLIDKREAERHGAPVIPF